MRRDRYRPYFFYLELSAVCKNDCIRCRRQTNVQQEDIEKLVIDSFSLYSSSSPSLCIIKGVIMETDDTELTFAINYRP